MKRNILSVITGALFLCFAALNNKYPLLTADSGGYINSGFTKNVPFDRTIMYGLFVAHASWGISLWLVMFSQALALSLVLFYYFRYFIGGPRFIIPYLACLFFATFMMSASVTTSSIGPGVFAGLSILCTGLLLFAANISKRDLYIICIIMVVSIGMDVSYLAVSAVLVVSSGLWILFRKNKLLPGTIVTGIRRVLTTGSLVAVGWLLVSAIQFGCCGRFSVARDNDMYTFPRLIKTGLVKEYLDTKCGTTPLEICHLKNTLDSLVTGNSRFNKQAMTAAALNSYREMAKNIHTEPGFFRKNAGIAANDFLFQLVNIEIGKYGVLDKHSDGFNAVYEWYNDETREWYISAQMNGWLDLEVTGYLHIVSVILCAVVLLASFMNRKAGRYKNLVIFFLLAFFNHALINALLYGRSVDMQSHIAWLLSVPAFLLLAEAEWVYRWKQALQASYHAEKAQKPD